MRCCQCPEAICGVDVDDLFAYQTGKFVRIRDRRLGLTYYAAVLGVFAYIGVYTLAYNLAYLDFHTPTGTVRFKLQQPVEGNCDVDSPSCRDAFPPMQELMYCCQHEDCKPAPEKGEGACYCPWRSWANYRCAFYDGNTVGIPQRSGMFVATRLRMQRETVNKSCTAEEALSCDKLWTISEQPTTFVAGIENFTVLIDHAAQVPELSFSQQSRYTKGLLHVPGQGPAQRALCALPGAVTAFHGGSPTTEAPCWVEPSHPPNSTLDFFHVGTLLTAAGVDLDEESFAGSRHSARYEGLTMLVNIHYYNAVPWKGVLRQASYYYEIDAMRENAYGQHQVIADPFRRNRTVIAMHGVLMQANLGGRIAGFDFNNLVLQLAASLALLAGATTGVNYVARYMLRYRAYYSAALIDKTADFSSVAQLEALPTEELREACRVRSLAAGGRRVELISRLISDDFEAHHHDHGAALPGAAGAGAAGAGAGGGGAVVARGGRRGAREVAEPLTRGAEDRA